MKIKVLFVVSSMLNSCLFSQQEMTTSGELFYAVDTYISKVEDNPKAKVSLSKALDFGSSVVFATALLPRKTKCFNQDFQNETLVTLVYGCYEAEVFTLVSRLSTSNDERIKKLVDHRIKSLFGAYPISSTSDFKEHLSLINFTAVNIRFGKSFFEEAAKINLPRLKQKDRIPMLVILDVLGDKNSRNELEKFETTNGEIDKLKTLLRLSLRP
jgi:hypothetical protein